MMTNKLQPSLARMFPALYAQDVAHTAIAQPGNVLAIGTYVMTMDGLLPVEYLNPGDRIITRGGMRTLRAIDTPAPHAFALTFDKPEVIYADGEEILIDA